MFPFLCYRFLLSLIQIQSRNWERASFSRQFYDNPNWKSLFSRKLCPNNLMHFHSIYSVNVSKKTDWASLAVIFQGLSLLFGKEACDLNRKWTYRPLNPLPRNLKGRSFHGCLQRPFWWPALAARWGLLIGQPIPRASWHSNNFY